MKHCTMMLHKTHLSALVLAPDGVERLMLYFGILFVLCIFLSYIVADVTKHTLQRENKF